MLKEIKQLTRLGARPILLGVLLVVIVFSFASLNAIVDALLHPESPFFDGEHLIVGAATGLATVLLLGSLLWYFRRFSDAVNRIRTLEELLSMCMVCKKIQLPNANPELISSWQPVD